MLKHNNTPMLMEVSPPPPPVLGVGGSSGRGLLPTFAIQHLLNSKQKGQEDKYSHSQDSASKRGGFKGICDEVHSRGYFNPGVTRWGSICCFSQWIAPGEIQVFPC